MVNSDQNTDTTGDGHYISDIPGLYMRAPLGKIRGKVTISQHSPDGR
jgi:hypothetical protein